MATKKTTKKPARLKMPKMPASLRKRRAAQTKKSGPALRAMSGVYDPSKPKRLTPNQKLRNERDQALAELAAYKQAVRLDLPPTPDALVPPGRDYVADAGPTNDEKLGINRTVGFASEGGQIPVVPVVPFSVFLPENYTYESSFNKLVREELARARVKHSAAVEDLRHHHSVIREEFDEFETEVYADAPRERVLAELVQLASTCRRAAEDVFGLGME